MYPYIAWWITGYRDLPLRLNQNTLTLAAFSSMLPTCARSAYGTLDTVSLPWRDETGARYLHSTVYGSPGCFGCPRQQKDQTLSSATDVNEVNTGVAYTLPPLPNVSKVVSICRELGQNLGKQHGFTVPDPSFSVESHATPVYVWQNSWSLSIRPLASW